ncbi:MAG: hypothetical protein ACREP2_05635 [Rhodanobacteraceae bacterium]
MHKPSFGASMPAGSIGAAVGVLMFMLLGGCGKSVAPAAAASRSGTTPVPTSAVATPEIGARPLNAAATPAAADATLAARTGELSNPDNPTMVYLYYDLAGIAPPVDQWVENDSHVQYAKGADKAVQRAAVKTAFEAGLAAVHGVGVIHLTTYASLSQYDPTYGEFTIGALSPGSVYTFKAVNQTVSLKFNNALAAQSWSVPNDKAQTITDKYGDHQLNLDTTLKIEKVLPDPAGGTIVARVVSWNLRDGRDGTTVARVQVPNP